MNKPILRIKVFPLFLLLILFVISNIERKEEADEVKIYIQDGPFP